MVLIKGTFFRRISVRLAFGYGLTMLFLLGAFSLFTYTFFRQGQVREFDRHLLHERMQLLPYVDLAQEGPRFSDLDEPRAVAYQTEGTFGTFVRLLSPDGTVLYRSPNLADRFLEVRLPVEIEEASVRHRWQDRLARSLYTPLLREDGSVGGWLEVTGFEWTLEQELYRLAQALLLGILLSVVLAILGGFMLARRTLQPVASMTEAADRIRATDLSARLPVRFGVRDELAELAETFNRMIERLESSFGRERRFTDNAAHELLTPLSTIGNAVQVALRRDRSPDAYIATLQSIQIDVEEMTETVRGLLQLARIDRVQDLPREKVDLTQLVTETVDRNVEPARTKGITLRAEVEPDVWVLADTGRLGDVLNNLLDNALKYTPAGGRVTVSLDKTPQNVRLTVKDSGIGFVPEAAGRLFDRFYRSDAAEVQQQPGSGLGLSIVQAIIEVYEGTISAESEGLGRGSRFSVWLKNSDHAGR